MSVEDNENIEKEFNRILATEYKQDWQHIKIPSRMVAVFCFAIPALLMLSTSNYHQNITSALLFSLVIGIGFYSYYRYHQVFGLFFSNSKPLKQIINEVKAQETLDNVRESMGRVNGSLGDLNGVVTPAAPDNVAPEEDYADFESLISQLEASLEPDTMNLSTLFNQSDSEQATLPSPRKRLSWLQRLLGRK